MPDAHLTWLVFDTFESLLARCADVDDVIVFKRREFTGLGGLPGLLGFLRGLRRKRFDAILDFQGLFRTGVFTFLVPAAKKAGFAAARECAPWFYQERVDVPADCVHAVDRNLHLAMTVLDCPGEFRPARFTDDPAAAAEADTLCASHGLNADGHLLAVAPACRWESKTWPVTFFADTIRHVLDGAPAGTRVWLLGTGDERSVGDALVRACADLDVTNLMGDTTLSVVIEMLKRSRLLLTNDSGPMHLAAALGVETVALFGPTDPERTGPYGSQHEVFASQVECAPCFERRCPLPKQLCLYDRSSPEAVSARVLEGLTRAPSRTTDG